MLFNLIEENSTFLGVFKANGMFLPSPRKHLWTSQIPNDRVNISKKMNTVVVFRFNKKIVP